MDDAIGRFPARLSAFFSRPRLSDFGAKIRKVECRDKSKRSFRFGCAETEYLRRSQSTKSRVQRQIKTQFSIRLCRDGVSKAQPKIRKVECRDKSKRSFQFGCAGTEVSKAEPKYEKPSAETNENAVFDSAVPVPKYPRRSQSAESRAQKQKAGYSRFCPYSESGFESPFRRQHRLQFTPPVGIALRTQNPITERRTRIGIRTAVIHIDRLGGD